MMTRRLTQTLIGFALVGALAVESGCKRDDPSKDSMSSGSSGVMSNSAAVNGTGNSDAANRVNDATGAAASSTNATSSEPAVNSTPPTQASGASQ